MGGDMPERRAPSTAGSDDSGAAAVRPEEQRHRWRRNPALSPQVKLAPHYISTGGDMPERRAPSTAGSDDSGAAAVRPEEQRHRWRRNPALSPQVKLAPHYISTGGDMPGARVPSTALSDDGGRSGREVKGTSPHAVAKSAIVSAGESAAANHLHGWRPNGPPGQSPGAVPRRAGGLKRGQAGRRGATRLAVAMGVAFNTTSANLHEGVEIG